MEYLMTPEQLATAKSIVQHAAVNSLETEEVMLLGHAIQTIEANRSYIKSLQDVRRDTLAVLDSYQPQEIAKVIKIPLGQDIGPFVLPWIQKAIEAIDGLRAELARLRSQRAAEVGAG